MGKNILFNAMTTSFLNLEPIAELATAFNKNFKNESTGIIDYLKQFIEHSVTQLPLEKEEQEFVKKSFNATLLSGVIQASQLVYSCDQTKDKLSQIVMSSETVLSVLTGISKFKESIDTKFPGLSDVILSIAAPAIVALVSLVSPAIGLVLANTTILQDAFDSLKTPNLKQTIDGIKDNIEKINNDKDLKALVELATTLSENLDVSPASIMKLNLSHEDLINISQSVKENTKDKDLMVKLCEFSQKLPSNADDIDKMLAEVKNHASVSDDQNIELDSALSKAKKELTDSLDPSKTIFEKIASVQKAASIIDTVSPDNPHNILTDGLQAIKDSISKHPPSKILSEALKLDNKAKQTLLKTTHTAKLKQTRAASQATLQIE